MIRLLWVMVVALAVFTLSIGVAMFVYKPAIEEGKVYKIGYTYKATLPGYFTEARVFDFADRNIPEKSVIAPLADKNGLPLVVLNDRLPEATARLTRMEVPGVTVEGIEYSSGYTYLRWEYNPSTTERQSVVPIMTPKR